MNEKDLIITPLYVILIYIGAYLMRPFLTDSTTRKYFIPALTVKLIGGFFLGIIYYYYYTFGDTIRYFEQGKIITSYFDTQPSVAIKLLLAGDQTDYPNLQHHFDKLSYSIDGATYWIVKLSAVFGMLCFQTYTIISMLFSTLSFFGVWFLFKAIYQRYPKYHFGIALSTFFIPSVFFWGSGLLKDPLTFGAIGFFVYGLVQLMNGKSTLKGIILMLIGAYMLITIKIYIFICLFPTAVIWVYTEKFKFNNSVLLKYMLTPIIVVAGIVALFFSLEKLTEDNKRFALENITETAEKNATAIFTVSQKGGGSSYDLGIDDWSPTNLALSAPAAINVTLFRPYLWETKNPVMLLSALESFALLLATLFVFWKIGIGRVFRAYYNDGFLLFFLAFTLLFAFSVGITTMNFGSLVRYKIPIIPMYASSLYIIYKKYRVKLP